MTQSESELKLVERLEAECSAELPELSDATVAGRAQRLLDYADLLTSERERLAEIAG